MHIPEIPFETTNWAEVEPTTHPGEPAKRTGALSTSEIFASGWWITRPATSRIIGVKKGMYFYVWRASFTPN
jgi:hypothetical protein